MRKYPSLLSSNLQAFDADALDLIRRWEPNEYLQEMVGCNTKNINKINKLKEDSLLGWE